MSSDSGHERPFPILTYSLFIIVFPASFGAFNALATLSDITHCLRRIYDTHSVSETGETSVFRYLVVITLTGFYHVFVLILVSWDGIRDAMCNSCTSDSGECPFLLYVIKHWHGCVQKHDLGRWSRVADVRLKCCKAKSVSRSEDSVTHQPKYKAAWSSRPNLIFPFASPTCPSLSSFYSYSVLVLLAFLHLLLLLPLL